MTTQDLLDRAQSIIDEIRSDAITPARMGELVRDMITITSKGDSDIQDLFASMIYNVSQATDNYAHTPTTARAAVPTKRRKKGSILSYKTTTGDVLEMFTGSDISLWTNENSWTAFGTKADVKRLEEKNAQIERNMNGKIAQVEQELNGDLFTLKNKGVNKNGNIVDSVGEMCTDYLLSDKDYYYTGVGTPNWVAFYDINKVKISVLADTNYRENIKVVIPDDCKYVVFCSSMSVLSIIRYTNINDIDIKLNTLTNDIYSIKSGDCLTEKLDINKILDSVIVTEGNWDWQNAWLRNNGVLTYDTNEPTCRYLKVLPSSKYVYNGMLVNNASICFYDNNFNYISGKSSKDFGGLTTNIEFETPTNCSYIRATCIKSAIVNGSFSIVYKGDSLLKASIPKGGNEGQMLIKRSDYDYDCAWVEKKSTRIDMEDMADFKINKSSVFICNDNRFKVYAKCIIPNDVHDKNDSAPIIDIKDKTGTSLVKVMLNKAVTSKSVSYPICPTPVYNAGLSLEINGKTSKLSPDGWNIDYLLGSDSISFRFTGDCSLVENQDLRMSITDSSVKIYRLSGETIKEYLKSSYPTIELLYKAIKSDIDNNILPNFEVNFINLDGVVGDLINCDVALVSEYFTDNNKTNKRFDAFPFYFTKKTEQIIEVELIYDVYNINHKCQLLINGHAIYLNETLNNLVGKIIVDIYKNSVTLLDCYIDSSNKSKYPNLRAYFFEGMVDDLTNGGGIKTSLNVASKLFNKLNYNRNYFCIKDILTYLNTGSECPDMLYHISLDDSATNVVTNKHILDTYLYNRVFPSIGMFMNEDISQIKSELLAYQIIGFDFNIHHVSTPSLRSKGVGYFSYDELRSSIDATIIKFISDYGKAPIIWDFHWVTENYNVIKYLRHKGFQLIFGGDGTGMITKLNRYRCGRWYVGESFNFDNLNIYDSVYV